MATEAARLPDELASCFQASIQRFSRFSNVSEPFYPSRAVLPQPPAVHGIEEIRGATHLSQLLPGGHGTVRDAPELDFELVDREIIPARITGGAVYDNDAPATEGKRLDWLLANANDQRMIVGEVKIGNDKNPFYAVVLLLYGAELVTAAQKARLREHYPGRFEFAAEDPERLTVQPSCDLYIILCRYNMASAIRAQLLEITDQLCERLITELEITSHIRRIACLDAMLDENNQLYFVRNFCHRGDE